MCFSANASFAAAAVLLPAGAFSVRNALGADRRFLPLSLLPILFGLQQLVEGLIWRAEHTASAATLSLAYMFFTWLAWPVWVPLSGYFLESGRRRPLYMFFAIAGGMIGALQYVPYFVHEGWLVARFLPAAISYEGVYILDFLVPREATYGAYLLVVLGPLWLSSERRLVVFGLLVSLVVPVTYVFFRYAYVSVFCFGGAVMSLYLVFALRRLPAMPDPASVAAEA